MAIAGLAASDSSDAGADDHQDGRQQHAVDREPPVRQQAALGARDPHGVARRAYFPPHRAEGASPGLEAQSSTRTRSPGRSGEPLTQQWRRGPAPPTVAPQEGREIWRRRYCLPAPPRSRCPAEPPPARGKHRRAPRSCETGRRRRRQATAARRAPAPPAAAASRAGRCHGASSVPQRSKATLPPASRRTPRSPRRSGRPWRRAGNRARARDAALLGLAADDPVDVARERRQRGGGAVGVGGLAVVDEERAALPADLLEPMRQARKRRERRRPPRAGDRPRLSAAALAASAFWMLWPARSGPMPARSAKAPSGPVQGALAIEPRARRAYQPWRDARSRAEMMPRPIPGPASCSPFGDVPAPVVVLADDGAGRALHQALFERRRRSPWCRGDRDGPAKC